MLKILSRKELLAAKCYSDIFDSNETIAKKQFRKYIRLYHPDVEDTDEANKIFEIIQRLYSNMGSSHSSASVSDSFIFKDKITKKGFEIQNPVIINNGTCMVYHTATKVVLKFSKDYKKFYEQYIRNIGLLRYADEKMEKQFKRKFPNIVKQFESTEGDFIVLLDKTPEVLNLGIIVESYEKMGKPFPEKQAAWIMNRLFNHAQYMLYSGKVFNGFSLSNLWVSPEYHTVLLLNGWEYTTMVGDKMLGCPKEVFNLLPVEARDKHISVTTTDLECIKGIGRELFKGTKATNCQKYFETGLKEKTPLDEWELYGNAVKADFGKREFIIWENVPYNKI